MGHGCRRRFSGSTFVARPTGTEYAPTDRPLAGDCGCQISRIDARKALRSGRNPRTLTLDFSVTCNQNEGAATGCSLPRHAHPPRLREPAALLHDMLILVIFGISGSRLLMAGSHHRPFFFWCVVGPARRTQESGGKSAADYLQPSVIRPDPSQPGAVRGT